MTNEQLAEIEARLNAATPAPWVDTDSKPEAEGVVLILEGSDPLSTDAREICVFCDMEVCDGQDLHNSVFVAHAPTDIAALIAEVRRLQALIPYDPMPEVEAYKAAHGGRSFTFRRGPNLFSWSGATPREAWANAGMPADEFGTWEHYEI